MSLSQRSEVSSMRGRNRKIRREQQMELDALSELFAHTQTEGVQDTSLVQPPPNQESRDRVPIWDRFPTSVHRVA